MALETTQAGTGLRDKEGWMEIVLWEVRVYGEGAVEAHGIKRGSGAASLAALHPGKSQRAVSLEQSSCGAELFLSSQRKFQEFLFSYKL